LCTRGLTSAPAPGDELTLRTLPVFFGVLELLLRAGVTVVAEAAFQDRIWRPRLEPLQSLARFRIVHCTVAAEVAARSKPYCCLVSRLPATTCYVRCCQVCRSWGAAVCALPSHAHPGLIQPHPAGQGRAVLVVPGGNDPSLPWVGGR
jgi:hypothetical protein